MSPFLQAHFCSATHIFAPNFWRTNEKLQWLSHPSRQTARAREAKWTRGKEKLQQKQTFTTKTHFLLLYTHAVESSAWVEIFHFLLVFAWHSQTHTNDVSEIKKIKKKTENLCFFPFYLFPLTARFASEHCLCWITYQNYFDFVQRFVGRLRDEKIVSACTADTYAVVSINRVYPLSNLILIDIQYFVHRKLSVFFFLRPKSRHCTSTLVNGAFCAKKSDNLLSGW